MVVVVVRPTERIGRYRLDVAIVDARDNEGLDLCLQPTEQAVFQRERIVPTELSKHIQAIGEHLSNQEDKACFRLRSATTGAIRPPRYDSALIDVFAKLKVERQREGR